MPVIRFKRGISPPPVLADGEPAWTTDTHQLYIGQGGTNYPITGGGGGSGTVTSINVSGGTTGLTYSGGPVTTSGTITMAGTLAIASGGTGATPPSAALGHLGGQPLDADLTSLAAASATGAMYYRSAANTWTTVIVGDGLAFSGGTLTAIQTDRGEWNFSNLTTSADPGSGKVRK